MAKKTILQALKENQKLLTGLDVAFLMGKVGERVYKRKRESLRLNVKKIIQDNNLIDTLKINCENILK